MKKELCEVCQTNEVALKAIRTWHDGTVDVVLVCSSCYKDDPNGAWKFEVMFDKPKELMIDGKVRLIHCGCDSRWAAMPRFTYNTFEPYKLCEKCNLYPWYLTKPSKASKN